MIITIKFRWRARGAHVHLDVFVGPRGHTLAKAGTLVLYPPEMRALAKTLEDGAIATPDVEIVWEES